jgi:hypothetical protein
MPKHTADEIRDISVHVYKKFLGSDDTRRMLEKDADDGVKLRSRAGMYDHIVKATLEAIGMDEPV